MPGRTPPNLLDTLRKLFDPSAHNTFSEVWLFFLATAAFGVTVNMLSNLLAQIPQMWQPNLLRTGFSLVILIALLLRMRQLGIKKYIRQAQTKEGGVPEPHRGILLLLSTFYRGRESSNPDMTAKLLLEQAKEKGYTAMRQDIFISNWGPLLAAVEHHCEKLEHVWIITTQGDKGSSKQWKYAKGLIELACQQYSRKRSVKVDMYKEVDANSVQETADAVSHFYHHLLQKPGWEPLDVIADFTSGTSAMSGGMQLGSLTQGYSAQYLRQEQIPTLVQDLIQESPADNSTSRTSPFTKVTLDWEFQRRNPD